MSKSDAQRERRLAEALRQNLRRRKAQARAADGEDGSQAPDEVGDDTLSPAGRELG